MSSRASPARSLHSFTTTFPSRKTMFLANEHDHHSLIVPEGDSLPKDRNSHKLDDKEKQDSKDNLAQDFTNFPPPIPDSGPRNEPYSRTTLQPYTSFLATRPLLSSSSHSVTSPTTLTITSSYSFSVSSTSFSSVTPSSSSDPSSSQRQTTNASSRKVPVPIIVAVSVGLAVFIGGAILLLRACSRPRRRDRPKPSLPILDDPFADGESYKSKDSPLFGGKERFSSQTAQIGALPPWTQYPQVAVIPPTQSPMSVVPDVYPSTVMHYNTTQGLLAPRPPPSQSVPTLGLGPSFMSGSSSHQATIGNSTNRLSTGTRSISVYPSSPPLAACDAAANTEGVGGPIPPPSDNSRRTPHAFSERTDDARSPSNTTHLSVSRGAYDGADVASPQFVAQGFDGDEVPLSPMPSGGRSRIKSSYTPGSYPRMSSVPSMLNSMNKRPNGDDTMTFDLRKLPPIHKPTEKSNVASSCLEMTSPSIPDSALHSPQPTLYPDDSLSVVYAKRLSSRRLYRKPTPKHYGRQQRTQDTEHELGTPGLKTPPPIDSGTALGSLMLMEFGATSKSTGLTVTGGNSDNEVGTSFNSSKAGSISSRTGPPRVPSPPALPSLAQMGLEHANPEAYAEYRSATYSIFGLYEGDRKSRIN